MYLLVSMPVRAYTAMNQRARSSVHSYDTLPMLSPSCATSITPFMLTSGFPSPRSEGRSSHAQGLASDDRLLHRLHSDSTGDE